VEQFGDSQWKKPPPDVKLLDGDVHIWRACLDQPASCFQQLAATLSADERLRAERFRFDKDRRHFSVGRGALRVILGRYLNHEPGQLDFCYNAYGKPRLASDENPPQIHFNVAHAGGFALYAATRAQEIGIDLEHIRPVADAEQIVHRYFSARERAVYDELPANQRQRAFFDYWTCKEAYIKAVGRGLSCPLDTVEIGLAPGQPPRLLCLNGDRQEAARWSLQTLTPLPQYAAAVAIRGHNWRFKYWDYAAPDLSSTGCGRPR
jgi:4'-phosphopantetheinyl transferase